MGNERMTGGGCSSLAQSGRVAGSPGLPSQAVENMKKVVFGALFASLSLQAYGAADPFSEVQPALDGLASAAVVAESLTDSGSSPEIEAAALFEPAGQVVPVAADESAAQPLAEEPVTKLDTGNSDAPASEKLAALDVADTALPEPVQGARSTVAVVPEPATLEVVDTGAARQVENPQAVAVVPSESGAPLMLEAEPAAGTAGKTGETGLVVDEQPAGDSRVLLPEPVVAEKKEIAAAGVITAGLEPTKEVVSGLPAREKVEELPYAVLLTILALMGMIPISRRNG